MQNFLRRNEKTGLRSKEQKHFKSEEKVNLINFALKEDLFYSAEISEDKFISAGAEQRVYYYDDFHVIKINDSIFYESWFDYFNSLLIHNYFFKSSAYELLGFKVINEILYAVIKQEFIKSTEVADLNAVKQFLSYNLFENNRNHDYVNRSLGILLEDLHDENVLSKDRILYFIDTIFYLTPEFFAESN